MPLSHAGHRQVGSKRDTSGEVLSELSGLPMATSAVSAGDVDGVTETRFFFSSSVADVALRLGPYMSVSRKYTVPGHRVLEVGKSIKATKPETTKPKKTTRKSPSQTCVSPAETAKQQQKNKTKPTKRGRSPNKNTHRIDLPLDAVV